MLSNEIQSILEGNQKELDVLSGNLLSAAKGQLPRTLLVTSPHPGEGRSTTAVALAYTLAREAAARVLLVDADMTSPSLHRYCGVEAAPGLSACLAGQADAHITSSAIAGLDIMPAGAGPETAAGVTAGMDIRERVADWTTRYDHVVLDTSPVLTTSVPQRLAPQVDGVLVVVACERTKWQVLDTVKQKLRGSGGVILGVILNQRRYYIPNFLYGKV